MTVERIVPYGMRVVASKDSRGREILVMLPAAAPDSHVGAGIRLGPPDLTGLGLPIEIEERLHHHLFLRGIITARDCDARLNEVVGALQAALRLDAQRIQTLYHAAAL